MQIGKPPLYRKVIIPWYDSETACFLLSLFLIFVCSFGFIGISVSLNSIEYMRHIWVPILLVVLSGYLVISLLTRMILRIFFSDKD